MKQNVNFCFFFSIYALPLLSIKSVPVCEKTFTFSFDTQSALQFGDNNVFTVADTSDRN